MSSSWLRIGLVFDGIQHEKTMLPVDLTRVETIQNLKDFVSETLTLETSSFDLYLQSFWLPPRAAVQGLLRDDDVITCVIPHVALDALMAFSIGLRFPAPSGGMKSLLF